MSLFKIPNKRLFLLVKHSNLMQSLYNLSQEQGKNEEMNEVSPKMSILKCFEKRPILSDMYNFCSDQKPSETNKICRVCIKNLEVGNAIQSC